MSKQVFIVGGIDQNAHRKAHTALKQAYAELDMSKRWKITIERSRRTRSTSQNGLYRKWCDIIADETGNDADDVHEILKGKFCPTKEVTIADEEREVHSTKHLTTVEFNQYLEKVHAWAARELSITLEYPEDMRGNP